MKVVTATEMKENWRVGVRIWMACLYTSSTLRKKLASKQHNLMNKEFMIDNSVLKKTYFFYGIYELNLCRCGIRSWSLLLLSLKYCL